jgi:hypothetical protein
MVRALQFACSNGGACVLPEHQEIVMSSSAVLPRSAGVAAIVAGLGLLLLGPGAAFAAMCGDDVNGSRTACSCGDEVVSNTTLASTDPVTVEPCSGDGLVISVPRDSDGITLDLSGLSIVGTGTGVGIRVVRGGRVGSSIVGGGAADAPPAEIANFRTGISGSGRNVLSEISGVYVHDNRGDGLRIHSSGVRVENVISEKNGRDGISVLGHGVEIGDVVADSNLSDGVKVRGKGGSVSADATGNLRHGLVVAGQNNRIEESTTTGNGGVGLVTSGAGLAVGNLDIRDNSEGDMKDRANAISGAAR